MKLGRPHSLYLTILVAALGLLAIAAMACSSSATPTAAPKPTAAPAPTAATAATATPRPAATATATAVSASAGPKYGGVFRFATRPLAEILTLDSHYRAAFGEYFVDFVLYDNLVDLAPDGKILPKLARSWDFSADGKTVTFKLQPNVKFQDGTPLNAQAVKWNLDRVIDPKVGAFDRASLLTLQSVETPDDSTVVLRLTQPWRPLLVTLTLQSGWMSSPTAVQKYNSYADRIGDYGKHPTGTGPFKLKEWKAGDRITVEKNPSYWISGKPYLDGMDFIGVVSEVQMAMVRTGEADIMEPSPWAMRDLRNVQNNPLVKIIGAPSGREHYVELDTNWGALKDVRVRQAIGYAIDRDTAVKVVFDGKARPILAPEPSGWWAYDENAIKPLMGYNVTKAKQLLADAGYANGITLPMWCRSDGESERTFCEIWQSMMSAAGITVDMTLRPFADITNARNKGEVHMESLWFTPRGDPHNRFGLMYITKGGFNYDFYSNPAMDKLIGDAAIEFDTAKANAIYQQAYVLAVKDSPRVFIAAMDAYVVTSAKVRNFAYAADLIIRLQDVWLDQ